MNKLVLMLVMALSSAAFADTQLPADALSLSPITSYVGYTVVLPKSPPPRPGIIVETYSVLELTLPLNGCLDHVGPVTYTTQSTADGKLLVLISATNIATKGSTQARCIAAPVANVSIMLGLGFISTNNVEVKMLDGVASAK